MGRPRKRAFDYDVCLSFAGQDRRYVEAVAGFLRDRGIRVFYDRYEAVALWGKDLYEHLHEVYSELARFCVVFISRSYSRKLWTTHERRAAQERAFRESAEYILPARFDNTRLPGIRDTVGYLDLRGYSPEELAKTIVQKVGVRQRKDYFPPLPDRLLEHLPLDGEADPLIITQHAYAFFEAIARTNARERAVIFATLTHGCPAELPENIHINLDLLRRITGISPAAIVRIVGGLSSLGFSSRLRGHGRSRELVKQDFLELKFDSLSVGSGGPATETASKMVEVATEGLCEGCGIKCLMNLDFSQLSEATYRADRHMAPKKPRKKAIKTS